MIRIAGICYSLVGNEVCVIDADKCSSLLKICQSVIIDEQSLPVTRIAKKAFFRCEIESIIIPETVRVIEARAFEECKKIRSMMLPTLLEEIGERTFWHCQQLSSISLPVRISRIEPYCFCYCTNLRQITIPDGVNSIGDYAFWGCSMLQSMILPPQLKEIGYGAFYGCKQLRSIQMKSSIPPLLKERTAIEYESLWGTRNCPILVPNGSLNEYCSNPQWIKQSNRILELNG